MDLVQLGTEIDAAWDNRDAVNASTTGAVRDAVADALASVSYTHLTLPTKA